jgi:hypothetical protein
MNLLEFDENYRKMMDKVRTEDLREIKVLIVRSSGETLFCLMCDEEVIDYFKVI